MRSALLRRVSLLLKPRFKALNSRYIKGLVRVNFRRTALAGTAGILACGFLVGPASAAPTVQSAPAAPTVATQKATHCELGGGDLYALTEPVSVGEPCEVTFPDGSKEYGVAVRIE